MKTQFFYEIFGLVYFIIICYLIYHYKNKRQDNIEFLGLAMACLILFGPIISIIVSIFINLFTSTIDSVKYNSRHKVYYNRSETIHEKSLSEKRALRVKYLRGKVSSDLWYAQHGESVTSPLSDEDWSFLINNSNVTKQQKQEYESIVNQYNIEAISLSRLYMTAIDLLGNKDPQIKKSGFDICFSIAQNDIPKKYSSDSVIEYMYIPSCQYMVGAVYHDGISNIINKDYEKTIFWYTKVSNIQFQVGLPDITQYHIILAQFYLAKIFFQNKGLLREDLNQSMKYYKLVIDEVNIQIKQLDNYDNMSILIQSESQLSLIYSKLGKYKDAIYWRNKSVDDQNTIHY